MQPIRKILVVDDDHVCRLLASLQLKQIVDPSQIITANNGKQALSILYQSIMEDKEKEFDIDWILLDLNMPVMDGFEFLEHFYKLVSLYSLTTCVTVLSSSTSKRDQHALAPYPIQDFWSKPLQQDAIQAFTKATWAMPVKQ